MFTLKARLRGRNGRQIWQVEFELQCAIGTQFIPGTLFLVPLANGSHLSIETTTINHTTPDAVVDAYFLMPPENREIPAEQIIEALQQAPRVSNVQRVAVPH